jgi:linoleoyl-CoA desaturase
MVQPALSNKRPATQPVANIVAPDAQASQDERVAAFGRELDALRREVELQLGESDAAYIARIGKLSDRLELLGRSLIMLSFEPVGFGLGTAALWAHKTLELMEIGHMALHGAYDSLPHSERFQSERFRWKAPIDEASWKHGHNVRHHQFTNIAGKDPDLDFGALRLSPRIPWKALHALQPLSNYLTWLGFATAINLHVTGVLDIYFGQLASDKSHERTPKESLAAQGTFLKKWLRYYGREYVFFPMLAGPFFAKVMLGNALSELGRDLYAAAIIYCGHVGAEDFPEGYDPGTRAAWYAMQAQAARDVEVPHWVSVLCGGLDLQIEHHLFPRLPPNRLREIAPRVREICAKHGVTYRSDSWPTTLRSVVKELARLRSKSAPVAA